MTSTQEQVPRVLNPAIGLGRLGDDEKAVTAAQAYLSGLRDEISAHNSVAAMMSSLDDRHEEFYGVGVDSDMRLTGRVYTDLATRTSDMDAAVFEESRSQVRLDPYICPEQWPDLYSVGIEGEFILEAEYLIGSFQAIEHFRPHDSHDPRSSRAFAVHIQGRTRTMLYVDADSTVQSKVMRKGLGE